MIHLKNPHSILAALEKRPEDFQTVTLPVKSTNPIWDEIASLASQNRVSISKPRPKTKAKPKRVNEEHRSAWGEAFLKEKEPLVMEEVFTSQKKKGLWLVLDCIQDPQNLGSLFRSASFFGVQGILISKDRSSGITSTVYDVACGGVEYVPFCVEPNVRRALEFCKENEFWILGTSEHADKSYTDLSLDRKWILVLGNEEKGMRRLTIEGCDEVCTIPSKGDVQSLNVALAGSVLMSHFS